MGGTMSDQGHLSELGYEGQFGLERRGYNRLQVDEAIAALRLEVRVQEEGRRDIEEQLSRTLDEAERLKLELSAARSSGRPPHEEISERIGQILKLADDEAKSQRTKAEDEIARLRAEAKADTDKLRAEAKAETDKNRAEAQEQAERMLSAAQEQAENTVSSAKAEAESTRKSTASEAQQLIADASKQAETAVATAKSQAKQQLDEATARATAIHDGAERRLNLLMSRHTEAIRRLTEIRDVVTSLVAGEADRGSLEDEVARIVAGTAHSDAHQSGRSAGNGRPGNSAEGRHAGGLSSQPEGRPSLSTAQRPGQAAQGQAVPSQATRGQAGAGQAGAGQAGAGQSVLGPAIVGPAGASPVGSSPVGSSTAGTQAGPGNGQYAAPAQNPPSPGGAAPDRDDTAEGIKIVGD
jgi:F0F1-type ATP synthase membrane subunit b/b'